MKPGAPTYIERKADSQLYDAVVAGDYCSVLTTRQMGKSSLMARTAARLREQNIACATVDLQGRGDQTTARDQWYYGFLKEVAGGLGLSFDLAAWWKQQELLLPTQRLTDFFADVVLKQIHGRTVVFVDEVDWMIRLPFSDEFFAAVRFCFNRRATDHAFERLTFVLLGSASPSQLIKDATRTPFNVGRGIDLTDFTLDEAKPLAHWLGRDGDAKLARILFWTDGHPYLTQMLCENVLRAGGDAKLTDAFVDSVVADKLLSTGARQQENNLKFVADRLTQGTGNLRRVLRTYRDVLRGKTVVDKPASPIHSSLRMSGIVKRDREQRLQVRNRIYRQVFDEKWVQEKTPTDWVKRTVIASVAVVIASVAVWYFGLGYSPTSLKCGHRCWVYQHSDSLPEQPPQGVIRLAIGGDSRDDKPQVVPWAFEEAKRRGAMAFFFLGDMEVTSAIDNRFVPQLVDLGDIPFYPAMGDHEVETLGIVRLYKEESQRRTKEFKEKFLTAPGINLAPLPDEVVYSVDLKGGIHFIALDNARGEGFGSAQLAWLAQDLKTASAGRKVILVGMHKGLANNPVTLHAMDEDGPQAVRDSEAALALFDQYSVAMVFVSHSHMYAAYPQGKNRLQVRLTGGMGAPLVKGLKEADGGFHHFLLADVSPSNSKTPVLVQVVKFPCRPPCTPSRSDTDESQQID